MADDRGLAVPASLSVAFPRTDGTADYTLTYTLASLPLAGTAAAGWLGTAGRPESVTLHSAAAYDGTNASELATLAQQMLVDWLGWRRGRAHLALIGCVPWQPDGHADVEWEASNELICTRARSVPLGPGGALLAPALGGTPYYGTPGTGGSGSSGTGGGGGGGSSSGATVYYQSSSAGSLFPSSSSAGGTITGHTVYLPGSTLEICGRLVTCSAPSVTITTTQNNYTPAVFAPILPLNVTSSSSLTGLVPPDVTHEYTTTLVNTGTATLTVTNQDSGSSANYRFTTTTGGSVRVFPGATLKVTYDPTALTWRVFEGTSTAYDNTPGTASFSTTRTDYAIPTPTPQQYWNITSTPDITGFALTAGLRRFTATNTGSGTATIKNDATSASANRIYTPDGGDLAFGPGQTVTFTYDDAVSRWRVSEGTAVAYAAASASGGITGTGSSGELALWTGATTIGLGTIGSGSNGAVLRRSLTTGAIEWADLALASTYQPLDSDLTAIAALSTTSFGRSLLTQADASAARTTLGLAIGTDVQAYDAELAALAGLTSAADKLPYFTGSGTAAVADFTAAGRALVDDADAAAQRTTLGLTIGTNVQAWDADLDALAALSGTNTIYYRSAANTWSAVTVMGGLSFAASNLGIGDAAVGALVGLTPAADLMAYYTGASTAATTSLTSFGRSLIDDANAAAGRTTLGLGTISTQDASNVSITGGSITGITDLAVADGGTGASTASGARTNLGLAIGTDVQAYDAELAVLAGLTFAANSLVLLTGAATATVGQLTNAYVSASAAIDWSKISKTGSSLADLATRSAGDLSSGTLAVARGGTNLGSYSVGDLLYASNTTVLAGLPIGSTGYVLTVSGGVPSWASPTSLPTFVAAGGSAAKGLVPAPGATSHSNRPYYLGDDAAWHARLGECLGTSWVATGETTTSGTPADLATSQSVTFTLDETSNVLALASAEASNTAANANVIYVYNGTTSQEVSRVTGTTTNCVSGGYVQSLAAGTYTFKMRFATGAGTATFSNRMFSVWRV